MNCRWHIALLVLLPLQAVAQEICNNGIDDDGNGLIDLNDPACPCAGIISGTPSFIPNPSFEDLDTNWIYVPQLDTSIAVPCCPMGYNLTQPWFDCAQYWNQATHPTTDLFNECGLYPDAFPIPPPDGVGFVGMRMVDGWQEYVGACLTWPGPPNPLQAGVEYTLSFHVAGTSIRNAGNVTYSIGPFYNPDPIPLALFGNTNCVPFPVNTHGCPVPNGWVELASMDYHANGGWDQLAFTFTPDQEIRTVMFGTGCTLPASFMGGSEDSLNYTPYLLLDNLHLTQATDQVLTPVTSMGHVCTNDVVVTAYPPASATGHQWYLNGVALVGETGLTLNVSALGLGSGTYTLASTYNGQCLMGSTQVSVPMVPDPLAALFPAGGCAPLTVAFSDTTGPVSVASAWSFGDGATAEGAMATHTYTTPGVYDVTLRITTAVGCTRDSTLVGAVTVHPDPVGAITATPNPTDVENTTVVLSASGSSGTIVSWWWDLGEVPPHTSSEEAFSVDFPAEPGSYPVVLVVQNAEGCVDTVRSVVVITLNGLIEMPNVFSPNGDGHNDRFVPLDWTGTAGRLEIYNRWGQLLYSTTALAQGWNGRAEGGGEAPAGTYYYIVTPLEGDGEASSGHVTLLR